MSSRQEKLKYTNIIVYNVTGIFPITGPSVFPSGEPGVSGDFWGSQEDCQGPSRPSGDWREMVPHSGFDLHFSDNE